MRYLPLVAVVLLGLLTSLWFASGNRGSSSDEPVLVALPDPSASEPVLEGAREILSATPPEPESGLTARKYLEDFYGEGWPAVRAKMEAAGAHLDVPYTPHPWEEVEPLLRSQASLEDAMRTQLIKDRANWAEPLTNEWLHEEFPGSSKVALSASELDELVLLVAPEMLEYEATAQAYCDLLDMHLRSIWEQGRFKRAPYTDAGLNDERGFYAKGIGGYGWAVAIVLADVDYPDLVALDQDMRDIVQRRNQRVSQFLRAHAPR